MKLYSPYVKHTRLIKYHFSKSHAIFFFIYRIKKSDNVYGVHFNLIMSIEEIMEYIKEEKYLINQGTNIFIIKTIDSTEFLLFDHNTIDYHLGRNKLMNKLSNE